MRRPLRPAAVCAAALLFASALSAELTPERKQAAETLIREFSNRRFAVRQGAVQKLIELGPDVVPLVRKALAATVDKEVKLRCQLTLRGIATKYGIDTGLDVKSRPKNWGLSASKVTLKMHNVGLEEIVEALAEQSGNRLLRLPEEWEERRLSLALTDVPYWQALETLCARTGLMWSGDARTGEFRLVATPAGRQACAHAGPVVVKLESGTLRRDFRKADRVLNCRFSYFWEDRLGPVVADGWVSSVTGAPGTQLKLTYGWYPTDMPTRRRARVVPTGQILVSLEDVPEALEKLTKLEGRVRLTVGEGMRTFEIKDALAGGEKSATVDGVKLALTDVQKGATWYNVSVRMAVDDKEVPVPVYPVRSSYGLWLTTPAGARREGILWQAHVPRPPKGVVAAAGAVPIRATRFLVRRKPDVEGSWTLVYTMPRKTTVKEFPFTFTDLPLP